MTFIFLGVFLFIHSHIGTIMQTTAPELSQSQNIEAHVDHVEPVEEETHDKPHVDAELRVSNKNGKQFWSLPNNTFLYYVEQLHELEQWQIVNINKRLHEWDTYLKAAWLKEINDFGTLKFVKK